MTTNARTVQVLVDWVNPAYGTNATGGSDWTDISDYVREDQPITITRGRQDNISTVQPGRATFTVDNSDGRFTPGLSSSPYYPVTFGRRIQINVKDESGTYHTRFDGQINEIDVTETATGEEATALFTCTDVLAQLNRGDELSCATVEFASGLSPALQYIMNEPTGSSGLKDSSGNNGPMLIPKLYTGQLFPVTPASGYQGTVAAPSYAYSSGNGPVEGAVNPVSNPGTGTIQTAGVTSPLSSVYFGAGTINTGQTQAGFYADTGCSASFEGNFPSPITVTSSSKFFIICSVFPDYTAGINNINYAMTPLCLGNTRTGATLSFGGLPVGNNMSYYLQYYANFLQNGVSITSQQGVDFSDGGNCPALLAMTIDGTSVTMTVAVNSWKYPNSVSTTASLTIPDGTQFNHLSIGGMLGGGLGWIGNVSNVCVYDTIPDTDNLDILYKLNGVGTEGYPTWEVVQWLLGWAGVPSYWIGTVDDSNSEWDYFDITGSDYSTVLQYAQQIEKGSYFTDASGKINLYNRYRRMGYGAPALTLPAGAYNVGLKPTWSDQYLVNSEALNNERGGQGALSQNQDSIDIYGEYPNGSIQTPQQYPYPSYVKSYTLSDTQVGTSSVTGLFDITQMVDAADWDVNVFGAPGMKLAAVTIDMLSNLSTSSEYVAPSDLYSVEIGDIITLDQNLPWWPDEDSAGDLFIEGVTETYSMTKATIAWYTSPANQGRAWIPGDSTYGVLDSTARIGISDYASLWAEQPPIPTFSGTMNAASGVTGYVGSYDLAGLSVPLTNQLQPPLLFVAQSEVSQSVPNATDTVLIWDNVLTDTALGLADFQQRDYIIPLSGWYEIYVTSIWAVNTSGMRTMWINQAQQGGDSIVRHIAPVSAHSSTSIHGMSTSATIYCYRGDAISVSVLQDSGSNLSTSLNNGGSHMSIRYIGSGTSRN